MLLQGAFSKQFSLLLLLISFLISVFLPAHGRDQSFLLVIRISTGRVSYGNIYTDPSLE